MNATSRGIIGTGVAVAGLMGLSALSRFSYVAEPASQAVVRLAWRTPGTRIRECRHRTAEEMAKLPVHMREGEVCERRVLPYLLSVTLDESRDTTTIRAAGARQDRPLYVYRQIPLAPGSHHVTIDFSRQGSPGEEAPQEERGEPPHGEAGEAMRTPARLTLDTIITLSERDIALITYDPDARRLVIRRKTS